MLKHAVRDLVRNPRRTLASVAGIAIAVGLLSSIAFFVDSSSARMTQHAIAPVVIDMQAEVNHPLASSLVVRQTMTPKPPLTLFQPATATMTVTNTAPTAATFVVLDAKRPSTLGYVPGTTRRDGIPLADVAPKQQQDALPSQPPPSPTSAVDGGLFLGTLASNATTTVTYQVRASAPVPAFSILSQATARSLQDPVPTSPGSPTAVDLDALVRSVGHVPGVRATQPFGMVDLPAGSLQVGSQALGLPVKLIALDPAYLRDFPVIKIAAGSFAPGTALLSVPAAEQIGAAPGASAQLKLPGRPLPLPVAVGAVVDLSKAEALFANRNPDNQGEFVSAPYVVGVDMATFRSVVLPALRADAASPAPQAKAPTLEIQTAISRHALATDPNNAFIAVQALGRTIERVSPGNVTTINNLSDTLGKARTDATLAKVLFVVLGLPGVALAGYLSFYAGGLLADAQRRERALLRARGFGTRALQQGLAVHAVLVAALASVLGLALGVATATWAFPRDFSPSRSAYIVSGGIAVLAAAAATFLAMYVPARRSLSREVREEQRALNTRAQPAWLRMRLDFWLLAITLVIGGVFLASGGAKAPPSGEGQSVGQSFYVLLAPLSFWIGATLLAARGALALARVAGRRSGEGEFRNHLVRRTVSRSIVRRPAAVVAGTVALSLAVAFGVSLTVFVGTFNAEQRTDARFSIGSDVRITSGSAQTLPADFASRLQVPGVRGVSPVLQDSGATVGTTKAVFAAVDPHTFAGVAPLRDSFFTDLSAADAIKKLASDPSAVLIDKTASASLGLRRGDTATVQFPSRGGAGIPVNATLHVAGTFVHFPGYPAGVELVGNFNAYRALVGATNPDFFLLKTDGTPGANAQVAKELTARLSRTTPVQIDTTAKITNVNQSTLASLNLDSLGRVEVLYTLAMAALGVWIFVFGLLLRRRGEYIAVRALGMRMRQLRALILCEAGVVSVVCLVLGAIVGTAMAWMFVQILRQVFILPPAGLSLPTGGLILLAGLVLGAMVAASVIASSALRKLRLVEILRED